MMCIYAITNQVNGKCYIGSTVYWLRRRTRHIYNLRHSIHTSHHLQNAWNKYGEGAFRFEPVELIYNANDLIDREQWWINVLRPAYNICPVASSRLGTIVWRLRGQPLSVAHRAKISASHIGIGHTEATRAKLRLSHLGYKHPTETIEKMRVSQQARRQREIGIEPMKGRIATPETRAKMSAAKKGHSISSETRAKISASLRARGALV